MPSCGTAACRAGWLVKLCDRRVPRLGILIADRAKQIINSGHEYDNVRDDWRMVTRSDAVQGRPGTLAYAKRGASGLRKFMRAHKSYLQARLLKDVRKKR